MSQGRALLLVGSPKAERSTSEIIASPMLERLQKNGMTVEKAYATRAVRSEEDMMRVIGQVDDADLIILAFPLYVDSMPAVLIKVLERIHAHRVASPIAKKQKLVAIVNCGFPEPYQNDLAVEMCRIFARQTGIEFAGSARIGMGPSLEGKPLRESGQAKSLIKGLEMAAGDLCRGKQIEKEALDLMSKPMMPIVLGRLMMSTMGTMMWKNMMKDPEVKKKIYDRPYKA